MEHYIFHCLAKFSFEHKNSIERIGFFFSWMDAFEFYCRAMLVDYCSFLLFVCFGGGRFNEYHPSIEKKKVFLKVLRNSIIDNIEKYLCHQVT